MANNYTLGRGKVHFARFKPGTKDPDGFFYIGNTPEFNLTIESNSLDHYSSDFGFREKDESVPLEVNRTGSMTTDNIDPKNIALFFFGDDSIITTAAAASQSETIQGIHSGYTYKIGSSSANPAGVFGLDTASPVTCATNPGAVALVEGTDFLVDYANGSITFIKGSAIATSGLDIDVNYAIAANSRSRVISGSEPVEGAMMYVTQNPKGDDSVIYLPYVKIAPNGDYALNGDDWQTIPLSIEILKPDGQEAIYRDGKPVYS